MIQNIDTKTAIALVAFYDYMLNYSWIALDEKTVGQYRIDKEQAIRCINLHELSTIQLHQPIHPVCPVCHEQGSIHIQDFTWECTKCKSFCCADVTTPYESLKYNSDRLTISILEYLWARNSLLLKEATISQSEARS